MYQFLFLDLDDTILDFHKAERIALSKTFVSFGIDPSEQVLTLYHKINLMHWQMLERGELTRDQVLVRRFQELFAQLNVQCDPAAVAGSYEHNLAIGHYFLPGAEEAVKRLAERYQLYIASNGTGSVQDSRMKSAGLYPYFKKVFISEEIGFNKPSAQFFQACFDQIPDFDPAEAMMVGDSLTSDILGANQAGIAACWINPRHEPLRKDIHVEYEVESLSQLEELLRTKESNAVRI